MVQLRSYAHNNRYYDIIENGEPPTIERIGKNIEELIERFVRYMDDSKQDFVYLLSCLDEWNDELLFYLAPKVNILINHTAINKIKGYSFITSEVSLLNLSMIYSQSKGLIKNP